MDSLSEKGFSLVEVLVVIALISILVAIGVPAVTSQMAHQRLTRSIRDISTELQAARMKAIAKNIKYRVSFTINAAPAVDTYQLSYWNGASWVNEPTHAGREAAPGIDITSPGASFTTDFYPNGTATATSICMENSAGTNDRMKVTVQGSTGMITVTTGC